ncbi:MAG: PHP domain-containing protein [Proteobacteria bacterium]|nr:PHP domain-containing protein [Pseudomonadota bacterium]
MKKNVKDQWIDLHVHSNKSDGTLSPTALIDLAAEKDIRALAITDHDTLEGIMEAREEAEKIGILLIPGIEISAKYHRGTLHILGYGIDVNSPSLQKKTNDFRRIRKDRNARIIAKLQKLGIDLRIDEMLDDEEGTRSFGRPHIAATLMEKGVVSSMDEAFFEYLGGRGKAFVGKEVLSSKETIDMIHEAGGKAFLAHPSTLNLNGGAFGDYLRKLKKQGLDGVEIYSPANNTRQTQEYEGLCREMDMLVSAGSDFHGENKPDIQLGICYNGEKVKSDKISEEIFSQNPF